MCDTAQGLCYSQDGKTSSPWIPKDPAKAASTAQDILAAAAGAAGRVEEAADEAMVRARMTKRGGSPMKAGGLEQV